jgi:hypothetical protein
VRTALEKRDPDLDWGGMLEQICTASVRRYREGAPAVDLWVDDLGDAGKYLVRPFVFDDAVNIIYGPGDSGKSLDCLLLAVAVASGRGSGRPDRGTVRAGAVPRLGGLSGHAPGTPQSTL